MREGRSKQMDRVVDIAIELFKEKGYENVSINEICKAAGISRSSFYLLFAGKKEIIEHVLSLAKHENEMTMDEFVSAKNDFERMWLLCDRFLKIGMKFGPEMCGTFCMMELQGDIDVLYWLHSIDDWLNKLTVNCQKSGIILSKEDPALLAPLGVDVGYHITYQWAKAKGSFNLPERVRRTLEMVYNAAPEYRWKEEDGPLT